MAPMDAANSGDANSARSTGAIRVSLSVYNCAKRVTSAAGGSSDTNRRASLNAIRWAVAGW